MPVEWLTALIDNTAANFGTLALLVKAVLAIMLVCLLGLGVVGMGVFVVVH